MPTRSVRVLLFAGLRARAGESVVVEVEEPATVAALRDALESAHPELRSLSQVRFAVDQAFASDSDPIAPNAEVAAIPPVSGGHDGDGLTRGSHSLLSATRLSLDTVVSEVEHPGAGGIATFTGQVRVHSRGQTIERLEYEAYPEMAVRVMDAIATTIETEIPESRVRIHHRIGVLGVGEIAVVIAAAAPHRAEAFDACRAAIERLKQDVPIWKKEVSTSGESWIGQGP